MSGDINPNVPLSAPSGESVEVTSGDAAASFDELEAMFMNPEHRVRGGKKAKAENPDDPKTEKKAEPKKEPEEPPGKTKDLRQNAKPEEPKAETKKETKESKEPGEKEAKELEAKIKKMFKGKSGDKDLEIDEDTEFFVKVDGQEVPVKAKDLFSNYSGKVAWDKRFSEVETQRRAVRGDFHKLEGLKTQIRDMFSEQDPNIRLFKMSQLSGMNPIDFRKKFFDDTIKDIETYYAMSDEERKARDLEFENSYYKYQADAAQRTLTEQQSLAELDRQVTGLLQQHGIGKDKFVSRFDELKASLDKGNLQMLEQQGKVYKGNPTPEFIIETIQKDELWYTVEDALEGVKLNWTPEQRQKNILNLVNDAYANGIKKEHLPEIVSEIWGKARAKKIVETTERERQEHYEGNKTVPTRTTASEPLFFDDL